MLTSEQKTCQNCKTPFTIEPEDFEFYEKIHVPPPTWCPECRLRRRYSFRNETTLYRIKCSLCGEGIISMYSADKPFPIYCQKCWMSDKWNPLDYGQAYDFSKPFFTQFDELLKKTPRLALSNRNPVNSEYCNYAIDNKNCYLCFSMGNCEDCYYCGPQNLYNKNCVSLSMARNNEICSDLVDCDKCYKTSFSQNSSGCFDSSFLLNCRNCQDCLGCVNLRNKSYHILNQPYTKENYFRKVQELNLGSFARASAFKKEFEDLVHKNIHRFATIDNSINISGDNIIDSKNCRKCFVINDAENCRYCFILNGNKECYDCSNSYPNAELSYETVSPVESTKTLFCSVVWANSLDCQYADTCFTSANLFGCISLKNKKYCILNKQYSPEEYNQLAAKIIKQMMEIPYFDKKGRKYLYGEFFPPEISPFAYNETVSQKYFPMTKEQVLAEGLSWKDIDKKNYNITIKTEDIPDHAKEVQDSITKDVIECAHKGGCSDNCSGVFQILLPELQIYRQLGVPLPRLCSNCRNQERISKRNPLKLWTRKCRCMGINSDNGTYRNQSAHFHGSNPCPNEFATPYAPDRPEIVYCETCYQQEVI